MIQTPRVYWATWYLALSNLLTFESFVGSFCFNMLLVWFKFESSKTSGPKRKYIIEEWVVLVITKLSGHGTYLLVWCLAILFGTVPLVIAYNFELET